MNFELTEYVLMSNAMFVINTKDEALLSYYTLKARFDNLSCSILFRLPDKILDDLKHFGLYKLALRMGIDPFMTAVAFHRF